MQKIEYKLEMDNVMIYCNTNTSIDEIIKILDDYGAVVIKGLFNQNLINKLNNKLDETKPRALQNYFDLPWGYGNLLDDNDFKALIENEFI